jgi:hypothetical protein
MQEHKVTNHGPGNVLIRLPGNHHRFLPAGETFTGVLEALEATDRARYSVEPVEATAKPVMLCTCGKVLENPVAYAAHCAEAPSHFTKS